MIIKNEHDLNQLLELGNIAANIMANVKQYAIPGRLTREVDEYAGKLMEHWGVQSAPKTEYDFPGNICISVNHVVAHGVPAVFILGDGDVVNFDISITRDGYTVDMGETIGIGSTKLAVKKLIATTKAAHRAAVSALRHGVSFNVVGQAFSKAAGNKYNIIQNLTSHGTGDKLHSEPSHIMPIPLADETRTFEEGMVLAIEPFLTNKGNSTTERGEWELINPFYDAINAQYENTVIVTKTHPIVVTALRSKLELPS